MLNHEFPPVGGGASPVTLELCAELVRQGHRVDVVTMHYKGTARVETISGVTIYRTPALRKRPNVCYPHELATYLPGAFFKTLGLARKHRYDVIHCQFMVPGGPLAWLISRLTGIPFVVTCHGSDVPGHNPERFTLLHKMIKPAWRFLAGRAAAITAPSDFLRQKILAAAPNVQVQVIPNGLDVSRFKAVPKRQSILLCSRLFPFKGVQYFIEAVREMELDWQVYVIGDGPYLPELKRLAENSKTKIHFTGWLDKNSPEYIRLFSEASIFVFLSASESFGLVVAEAMASGCVVIASDISAHREVLADTGVFVQANNIQNIQKQLLKLIDDDGMRQQLRQYAKQRVSNDFAWKKIAGEYINLYKQFLRNDYDAEFQGGLK